MLHEADPATVLRNFTDLAAASTSVVRTDIPQEQLPELIELAVQAKDLPIASLQLVPPLVTPADPDFEVIRDNVERALEATTSGAQPSAAGTEAAAPTAAPASGEDAEQTDSAESEQSAAATTDQPTVDLSAVCAYE